MQIASHGKGICHHACRAAMLLAVVVLASACTTPRQMEQAVDERAAWRDRAEAPVEKFRFNFLRDWHPLEQDWLLLDFGGRRDLALQIRQPCVANVREAQHVSLVQNMPNLLHRQADRIRIGDRVCHIESMRPIVPTIVPTIVPNGQVRGQAGGV